MSEPCIILKYLWYCTQISLSILNTSSTLFPYLHDVQSVQLASRKAVRHSFHAPSPLAGANIPLADLHNRKQVSDSAATLCLDEIARKTVQRSGMLGRRTRAFSHCRAQLGERSSEDTLMHCGGKECLLKTKRRTSHKAAATALMSFLAPSPLLVNNLQA